MTTNKIKLTPRREKWAQGRGNVSFKGSPLSIPVSIERRYERELISIVRFIQEATKESIEEIYGTSDAVQYFAQDSVPIDAKRSLSKLNDKVQNHIKERSLTLVLKIMKSVNNDSKVKLSASIKEMSGGMNVKLPAMPADMKVVFSATIEENVNLIKSIGEEYLSQVNSIVMRSIIDGEPGIQAKLQKQFGKSKRRARLIATDQVRKAYNNVNMVRCDSLGIKKGIWVHTAGSKEPRPKHKAFNGKEFDLAKGAPIGNNNEYVHPGQEINCRCIFTPVVEFGES